jgi:hypothetical protein
MRKEMAAIQAEQQTQCTLLEQTREMVITSQAADYEARIIEFKSRMCKAQSDDAVATWRALVLDYQNRYLALTGRNFPTPSCADL